MGRLGALLECSRAVLEAHLGRLKRPPAPSWGPWSRLGALLGRFGAILEASWASSWAVSGRRSLLAFLEALLGASWAVSGQLRANFGHL
eukprot:2867527-Pyramimonas_sp.AAC.1